MRASVNLDNFGEAAPMVRIGVIEVSQPAGSQPSGGDMQASVNLEMESMVLACLKRRHEEPEHVSLCNAHNQQRFLKKNKKEVPRWLLEVNYYGWNVCGQCGREPCDHHRGCNNANCKHCHCLIEAGLLRGTLTDGSTTWSFDCSRWLFPEDLTAHSGELTISPLVTVLFEEDVKVDSFEAMCKTANITFYGEWYITSNANLVFEGGAYDNNFEQSLIGGFKMAQDTVGKHVQRGM